MSDLQPTVRDENCKQQRIQQFFSKFACPKHYSKEPENNKSTQQPSVICGSFTQIIVNPMQLQDHEFTAWMDRLVEVRKNRQER